MSEPQMSWDKIPKANEVLCLDMYKNSAVPTMAAKKGDLFSGLNQTVKVMKKGFITKITAF